jgi:2-polyprenyl-3-methyl-5-hydroxy-6-metoxy-1,4-benzoquinol methylase
MEVRYEHRADMAKHLPTGAKIVLDVGCNTGCLGEYLKTLGIEKIVGVDAAPHAIDVSKQYEDEVHLIDVEAEELPYPERYFDAIFYGDVLEHLRYPWDVLNRYRKYLKDDGVIIASIPNAGHFSIVGKLLRGDLHYEDAGILDRTHLRFFTRDSATRMLEDCGYEILQIEPNIDYQNGRVLDNQEIIKASATSLLQSMAPDANQATMSGSLFALQYIFVAKKKVT